MKLNSYRNFKQEGNFWRSNWRCRTCFDCHGVAFMVSIIETAKAGS